MTRHFRINTASLLLSVFICVLIAAPMAARAADSYTPGTYGQSDHNRAAPHDIVQGPHVEGHIAFLHAELRITPAQEPLWAPVAAAMREDVKNLQEAQNEVANQDMSSKPAIQYLENRVVFANLRAQGETRFLKALRPLYDDLSSSQRAAADELLAPRTSD